MYWNVKPVGLRSFLRLYLGLVSSFVAAAFMPGKFRSTGHLTPGKCRLKVAMGGVIAEVEPGSNSLALFAGVHEPRTTSWFDVKSGEVVVDVGSHVGRYSLIAAKCGSRVVSIEPDPSNFAMLESNIRLNKFSNITPLQLALSDSPGRRRFFLAGGGDSGTSSLEQDWFWRLDAGVKRREVEVQCETLDRLISSLGMDRIDWLKIDVEGHEISVLQGASATLSRTRKLILEVAEGNEARCQEIVGSAGFRLVDVDGGQKEQGLRSSSNWLLSRREDLP